MNDLTTILLFFCSGTLTDIVTYGRLLTETEVRGIVQGCHYPSDEPVMAVGLDDIESYGQATAYYVGTCPTLSKYNTAL